MHIAIDCADLDHSRIDGTRVYIKNVLNHLGKIDQQSQFSLYHQNDFNPALKPVMYPNYVDRKIPYGWWWTQTRFAYELRKDKTDVCWMPIQQLPYIRPAKTKFVVTIHDLAFKIFPQHFPQKDLFKLNLFTDYAVKNSDAIIAISNSTKKDILKYYPDIKEEKISVVYHGFEAEGFLKRYSDEEIVAALNKFNIKKRGYILYVGAIQPRKDLITLVKAFEKLKTVESDFKLVLVGEPAWQAEETLKCINSSTFAKDIILAGKVSFVDLPKIYQAAEVFVFPSLYEGFGIPILEAQASGVPVIVADNSSLVEIGGQAVDTFATGKPEKLADFLLNTLQNATLREEMIRLGKQQCQLLSWEKCARGNASGFHSNGQSLNQNQD